MKASNDYRPEIDGLRAFAVIPVVFYHAGLPFFGGGYVGVDVFFVISGYLITSLIITEIDAGTFSLLRFYDRRIRRIFPALFFVIACCAVLGWFVLAPADYKQLGASILATSAFLSNVLFWRQSGYFNTAAAENPLLHTWSLAVEEQFYIFFPLYLLLIARWFPRQRSIVTAVLCAMSLVVSAVAAYYTPWAAFYLAPTRAWELLMGALLAMGFVPPLKSTRWRNAVFGTGVVLIVVAVLAYTKATVFPGVAALLPAAGAALAIWAGGSGIMLGNYGLATGPAAFAGKISYSIYLWHYPLFAFAAYLSLDALSPTSAAYLLIALPLLAVLSWKFVEQPFRRRSAPSTSGHVVAAGVMVVVAFSGFGLMALVYNGSNSRMNIEALRQMAVIDDDVNETRELCLDAVNAGVSRETLCRIGKGTASEPTFLYWGDSHAEAMRPALESAAERQGVYGYFAGLPDCPALDKVVNYRRKNCDLGNQEVFRFLAENQSITTVVLAARWSLVAEGKRYKSEDAEDRLEITLPGQPRKSGDWDNHETFAYGLEQAILRLREMGKTIWIVGPIPEVAYRVPKALYLKSLGLHRDTPLEPTLAEFHRRQDFVLAVFHDLASRFPLQFIWPHQALCRRDVCDVQRDGAALYVDNNHLSVHGVTSISQIFDDIALTPKFSLLDD